jgi:hypothetical protein
MPPHRTSSWLARQLRPALEQLDEVPHELVPWEQLARELQQMNREYVERWLEHRPSVDA